MKNKLVIALAFLSFPFSAMAETENKPAPPAVEQKTSTKLPTFDEILAGFLDKTAKVGNKLEDAATKAGDFAVKEIPLVIQEYLTWHLVESILWSVGFGGMLFLLASILFKKVIWNNLDKPWTDSKGNIVDIGVGVGFAMAGVIILCIMGSLSVMNNMDWLKISVAPRVYLIDKAATFMKK